MSFSTIRSKVRNLTNENAKTGKDIFTFNSSKVFSLTEENVVSITAVYVNDVEISESGNWSYSATTNKITFASGYSLTAGDTIQVDYTYYPNYSDNELDNYIKSSLTYICIGQYQTFEVNDDDINPEPTEAEENLIALIVKIILKPDNQSIRLPDMSITPPVSSLPTSEMINRVISSFKKNTHGVFTLIDNNPTKIADF